MVKLGPFISRYFILNSLSSFGKTLLRYASAQVISNILKLVSGFLIVKFIDPELYGKFTGVGIYLGYILLGHGGIINGLGRELPFELGRGNDNNARAMASSAFLMSLIISLISFAVFSGIGIARLIKHDFMSGLIFLSYSISGGLYLLNQQYLPTLYRTNADFNSLSNQNILKGIGNLFTVVIVWSLGLYGLMIRTIFLALFEFILLFKNKPYQLSISLNYSHLKKLFNTGFPIFLVGYINSFWTTIMNNLIYSFGGAINYGLYALSNIIQTVIGIVPSSFGQVVYPRMSIMLGEGKKVEDIIKAAIKPLLFQFLFMLIISSLGAIILPIFVPIFLPKYINGISSAQWMCFVPVAMSLGLMNHIYNILKRQILYFVALSTGAIIGSIYIYLKIKIDGFNLVIFPKGFLFGTLIQQMLCMFFLRSVVRKYDQNEALNSEI
jgi:O-antigen/teichoic acid export membrane protein